MIVGARRVRGIIGLTLGAPLLAIGSIASGQPAPEPAAPALVDLANPLARRTLVAQVARLEALKMQQTKALALGLPLRTSDGTAVAPPFRAARSPGATPARREPAATSWAGIRN